MVRIATRASSLALVQAQSVRSALQRAHPQLEIELLKVTTTGDRFLDRSLEKLEGKGLFTDALERALAAGDADLACHSLKDLPTELESRFELAAVLVREDPRDAIISAHGGLHDLPPGALVGTDSSRRRLQLLAARPDLRFTSVRGNVPTRLSKLDRGEFDALVLAVAGLRRLGLADRAVEVLEPAVCLPAPGQGAIAVEALRESDAAEGARVLDDPDTRSAVTAERAFLAALGGGCGAAAGALAQVDRGRLHLRCVAFDGVRATQVEVEGPLEKAALLGLEAARRLGAGARP